MKKLFLLITILTGTAVVLVACRQTTTPPPSATVGLSIGAPFDGQTLAGTIAVVAGGVGGTARNLTFTLGSKTVDDSGDGTATINTRTLSDGPHTLTATATVKGKTVTDSIDVTVDNDLQASGAVGPDGGTLKSGEGSYASLPPGALDETVTLTLEDTTQQQILDDFKVDYEDLGVTFLGALTVDAAGASSSGPGLPVQVDLAGWDAALRPDDDLILMFNVFPDQNGDGFGELTFASLAQEADGSIVTRPTARTEAYGLSDGAGSLRQQQSAARPGEIVELQGRGLTPHNPLGNTAQFASGEEILVAPSDIEEGAFNPLQSILLAIPALGNGDHDLTLRNGTTNFESDALSLAIGNPGSGSQAQWNAFIDQVTAALEGVASGRDSLFALGSDFLDGIGSDATLHAMANNSGLVSSENLALLENITASSYSQAQQELVTRHALLLDAMAVTRPGLATSAADLASLLLVASPTTSSTSAQLNIRTQQASGGNCTAPSAPILWGAPTGMGAAPSASCGGGGAGGGSGGGSPIRGQRLGGFGPVEGALVRVLKPDGSDSLSPFTAFTDQAGQFYIPFIPTGEPFLLRAFDPTSGDTAEAFGISGGLNEKVEVPLAFAPAQGNGDGPAADFTILEVDDDFAGAGHYRLEANVVLKDGSPIVAYTWELDGATLPNTFEPATEIALLRNGSYTVRLSVLDDLGRGDIVEKTIVVSDLPYPYAAEPATRVSVSAQGDEGDGEADFDIAISGDGRIVAFSSNATNLVPGDSNGVRDVFVSNLQTGALERASVDVNGVEADADSGSRGLHLSGDGRIVAFNSSDTDLAPNCLSLTCIYVRNLENDTITAVTAPSINGANAADPRLNQDGSLMTFVDIGIRGCSSSRGIYLEDLVNGGQVLVSTAEDGTNANSCIGFHQLSPNGRYLVFSTRADNLVPDDTNGTDDIFLKDLNSGTLERISVAQDGTEGTGRSIWPSISADGRYVAFATEAPELIPGNAGGETQIVRKDLTTGAIELVSRNALGEPGNETSYSASISADGRHVAFGGYAADLVPGMNFDHRCPSCETNFTNGYSYVTDMDTGRVALLSYGIMGGWLDEFATTEPVISADGRYVVFTSEATNLIPGDTNGQRDVFVVENPLWEAP